MPSLKLGYTSHKLTNEVINDEVKKERKGNYALGYYRKNNDGKFTFYPKYVGRSDSDLQTEIKKQGINNKVKKDGKPLYTHFKFDYARTANMAYKKECENYHDFQSQLANEIHPARPKGETQKTLPCCARKTCNE